MLALCGQPYEVGAITAYFNSGPLLPTFTLAQLGVQAWSVVDVVIEADPVPRIAVPMDDKGTAKYSDIANHVAYSWVLVWRVSNRRPLAGQRRGAVAARQRVPEAGGHHHGVDPAGSGADAGDDRADDRAATEDDHRAPWGLGAVLMLRQQRPHCDTHYGAMQQVCSGDAGGRGHV